MLRTCALDGDCLFYATTDLQVIAFIETCIGDNFYTPSFLSDHIYPFILVALLLCIYLFVRGVPQADREVVLAAVTKSGGALKHASRSLQADRDLVLSAVRTCSSAFRYARLFEHGAVLLVVKD